MMKKAIMVLGATLVLVACTKDREKAGTTTTTGASTTGATGTSAPETTAAPTAEQPSTADTSMRQGQAESDKDKGRQGSTMTKTTDAIRARMHRDRPEASMTIDELVITDDGNVIIISGMVPDESTHEALVSAAKKTPGVKEVKDNLRVAAP